MAKTIYVSSEENCLVYINGLYANKIDNQNNFKLKLISNNESNIITIFFIDYDRPPITFNIDDQTNINSNYNIYSIMDEKYIFIKTINSGINSKRIVINNKNKAYNINFIDNKYIVSDNNIQINNFSNRFLDNVSIFENSKFLCLYNQKINFYSLSFLEDVKCIKNGYYKEIIIKDDTMDILIDSNDSISHGNIIRINNDNFQIDNIFINKNFKFSEDDILNIMCFCDCIKCSDNDTAILLMDSSLLPNNHENILSYFETSDEFYYLYSDKNSILIGSNGDKNKIFEFKLNNHKIIEIDTL